MTRLEQIKSLIEQAGSTFVGVDFTKKDGTKRHITFNPRDFNEIVGTGKPSSNPDIIRIREVNNKEEGKTTWRCFDVNRVFKVTVRGQVHQF